jgi:hypothetical protein
MDPNPTRKTTNAGNPAVLHNPKRDGPDGKRGKAKSGARSKTALEISYDVEGTEEFQAAINKLESALQSRVHRHLLRWAEEVKAEAARTAPVRTGYLRNSIYANH